MGRRSAGAAQAFIKSYLTGLALIAKSDLHLNFALQAAERFTTCLLEAMRHFGNWDGTDEGLPTAVSGFFRPLFKQPADEQELLDLLRQLRHQPLNTTGITLERAATLKVLCDVYLIRRFEMMAGDASLLKEEGEESAKPSSTSSSSRSTFQPLTHPYLEAGGTLENAQAMAAHESPRTTKLYDRTGDEITLDEVERIAI